MTSAADECWVGYFLEASWGWRGKKRVCKWRGEWVEDEDCVCM